MSHPPTNKHNYIEIVNRGVPEYYRETDYALYGSEEDISLAFLGNILKAALHNDLLFDVSGKTKEDVAEFFVPEKKTYVTSRSFEDRILVAYGLSLDDFATKSDLITWVSSTLLPDIELNTPTGFYSQLSSYAFGTYSSIELVHEYLLQHLGLFYILNTSTLQGGSAATCGSAVMVEYFVNGFYGGGEATEQQALNALFRFFWENREGSTFYGSFFPQMFNKTEAQISGDPYFSGTQMFDSIRAHLETWTDQRLKDHEFFKASLSALLTNTGVFPTKLRDAGPFQRFLKAISLGIADASLLIEELADLLSIDECPEKFLELLANNIGWQLLTGDYEKWRAQLRNAVLLYKSKGSVLGLEAACKLIFPDGIFEASSIVETWESYLPKMLYYMIKTSSFIAKEGLEFEDKAISFEGSWPEDVRFNQAPKTFVSAKDINYRFLVDGILEHFHNRYEGILINGIDFKTLPMWDCLPTVNGQKGFAHRNYPQNNSQFLVAVPPWEKYGFYKECELDEDKLDFFCKILSGSREEFGFEVDQYIVDEFRTLVLTQLNKVYALSGEPVYSENNKFRLFTDGHQLPPNYSSFVTYGNASSLEDFDTWNTKGSHLFAAFDANAIEYTVGGYDTFKNKAALETYRDVLRQFVPLHAVVRILLYLDLEDESFTSGTLCIFTDECLDEYNTNYLHSRRENFWAGASGGGDLGTVYVNGDGRILPVFSAGDFWQVNSDVLDRNTSRRRNYRYSLECYPYTRMGKGMPVAMNHYSGILEFNLKGFEYDKQSYLPPSSVVWDNSGFYNGVGCEPVQQSGDSDLSSLYPVRGVSETDYECSSLPIYRDTMKGVMEVMVHRKIAEDKFFDFSDMNYRSFEFGNSVHESYHIYKNEFNSVLKNTISPNYPYYGGKNFIAHAFGPTIWNSDFRYKGKITTNIGGLSGAALPGAPTVFSFGYEPQWEYVFGGTDSAGIKYKNFQNSSIEISNRPFFKAAPNTASDTESGVSRDRGLLKTREALSGIEIHQPYDNSKSFAVVNSKDRDLYNGALETSVSLYNTDGRSLEVVVPLDPEFAGGSFYGALRPQSKQRVDVYARTRHNRHDTDIHISLCTSGLTDNDGNPLDWYFSWEESKWIPYDMGRPEEFVKVLGVSRYEPCILPYSARFHTQDSLTVKDIPCVSAIRDEVHTGTTKYLLKVSNGTAVTPNGLNSLAREALTISEISIIDTELNSSMNGYDSSAIDRIYTFWDELSHGKYSRNIADASGYFEDEGGSRAEYIELVGGEDYSRSSTISGKTVLEFGVED